MATVDELIVKIQADTKDLRKKLGETNKHLNKIDKNSKQAGASMSSAFTTGKIAAVAAAAAFVKAGSSIATVGMQFEDLKDSLDQVFGSMRAGDAAMQKVFTFAQTTPFQIEDATKAFIALKSAGLEPNMQMLQTFADTASVSVDQLGTFEALIRMVQRSASGGMGLEELNMISDRGIDVLGILSEKLNLGKDDIAKFGKTADGAAKMVKALTEGLQERFGGAMEAKMDNLSTKASNMNIAFKQLADDVFQSGLGDFLKEITDALTEMATGMLNARRAARGELVETAQQAQFRAELSPEQRIAGDEMQRQIALDKMSRLTPELNALNELIALGKGNNAITKRAAELEEKIQGLTNRSINLTARIRSEKALLNKENAQEVVLTDEQIALQNEFNKLFQDTIPEYDRLQVKIDTLREALAAGTLDAKGNPLFDPEQGQAVLEHLQKLQDELQEVDLFTQAMEEAITSSAHAFTKDFVDSLLEGQNALESFKNFARNIVSQIITIFMQMAVVNQILNQVFNLTGANALPTIGGAQSSGTNQQILGENYIDTSNFVAGGGTVQRGSAYMVGERGPEIFVPNTGGTVMNNMNSKNAMGGGSVVVNQSVNFSTGVVPTVRAEVQKMLPQISDVTKGAVLEAAMRGGQYRKGLLGG